MSTADLKAVTTRTAADKPKDFPAMLQVWLPEIKRALPKHLNADRMSRIALTAFRRTPKLADCDPRSVFAAVIQASQLGLEPDTLGRSYLIPYGKECQFVPGWKGLMDLMNRSGQGSAWTGAVFEGDDFDYALGDSPFVKHVPAGSDDSPDRITHFYAIGRAKGNDWPVVEVWPATKVRRHRDRYNKVGKRHYSHDNWEMYGRKVVLLQVLKYLPCSAELVAAIDLNDAAEIGAQKIDLKDAIEGSWERAIDDAQMVTAGNVDKSTGEVIDSEKKETDITITADDVATAILNAKSADDVDQVLSMLHEGIAAGDQDSLRDAAKARREEIEKGGKK